MLDHEKHLEQRRRTRRRLGRSQRLGIAACLVAVLQGCATPPAVDSGVYVVSANGGVPERLGESAGDPVWAPANDAIAWATEDGLFLRRLTATEPSLLSDRVPSGRPAWSPDGRAIAFVDREAEMLVVLDAESGETVFSVDVATRDAAYRPIALPVLGGPAWSPDGSRLAFVCWDGRGDEICVVRGDGSDVRQVTHIEARRRAGAAPPEELVLAASNAGPPAWSPDGAELALAVYPEQRGGAAGVFVVDLEAGTARRASALLPNSEVEWFPDGESLLFSARNEGRSDAVRVPLERGEAVTITATLPRGAREPALAPDQSRLAVVSGGDVVVLDLEGNVEWALAGELARGLPAWSPEGDRLAFAGSPDPLVSYP